MKYLLLALIVLQFYQTMAQEKIQPTISVTGESNIKVVPDQVSVSMTVETTGKDALSVKTTNDITVNEVIKFIKQQGILPKDFQTKYVQIGKNYDYNSKTYHYRASQSITVLIKDLENYDALITGLMQKGINRIDGISFKSSTIENLYSQARMDAIVDAKKKADEYASVLNQKTGKALYISEPGTIETPFPRYKTTMLMENSDAGRETLAVGEMEINVRVQVVFELQ